MNARSAPSPIAAVIAAAGRSRRMGQPKQLLPWREGTVIQAVVENLAAASVAPILCVVGHRAEEMRAALRTTAADIVYNPAYEQSEMLASYQAGIAQLETSRSAIAGALFALSDQPHIPTPVIRRVVEAARHMPEVIVIPSYRMRRGHPIYLPKRLWPELLALPTAATLRSLINRHAGAIHYVQSDTDAILTDIDTPDDYARLRDEAAAGGGAE
jgi:molybdenum cofactor cytidylyltransferase